MPPFHIPTQFKSKIPSTLTWPIGAEAISGPLIDVPHLDKVRLWFWIGEAWHKSRFAKRLGDETPVAVFGAEYRPKAHGYSVSNYMTEQGYSDRTWSINIYPVPRPWRPTVNALIHAEGLPAVAKWLRSATGRGWEDREHRISLLYSPADNSLTPRMFEGV